MLGSVVRYDECLSSYRVSNFFSDVLMNETLTFVELCCM
jgi:hypothetical protein